MNLSSFCAIRRTRPRLSALILALIACCILAPFTAPAAPAHAAGTIYYVQDGASGTTCDSWASACDLLHAALDLASSGDEIRVEIGHLLPDNVVELFIIAQMNDQPTPKQLQVITSVATATEDRVPWNDTAAVMLTMR